MSSTPRLSVSPKFQNILFTTDFSPCSDAALPYARAVAGFYGSTVHVLHVVTPERFVGEFGVSLKDVERERELETEKIAQQKMDKLTGSAAFEDLLHTQTIEKGLVWDAVSKLVDDLQIDLIVLGTHGRHGLKHLMLGSAAEQIFRRSTCPVLTIGPEIRKDDLAAGKLATILFATDFSPASRHALHCALLLARTTKASITLLHVISDDEASVLTYREEVVGTVRQQLAGLIPDDSNVRYDVSVDSGTPADVIVEVAAETSADLIVMGAHRGVSASAHAPWAVAHRVVCEAPCAVLTVRA
jgi:nucleotide-binding universal stress UspA family protein